MLASILVRAFLFVYKVFGDTSILSRLSSVPFSFKQTHHLRRTEWLKTQFTMKQILLLVVLLSLIGCTSKEKGSDLKQKIYELEQENQKLKAQDLETEVTINPKEADSIFTAYFTPSTSYVFVEFKTKQPFIEEVDLQHSIMRLLQWKNTSIVSDIRKYHEITEDDKYRFLDEIEKQVKNRASSHRYPF